jgi:hypothetical protein
MYQNQLIVKRLVLKENDNQLVFEFMLLDHLKNLSLGHLAACHFVFSSAAFSVWLNQSIMNLQLLFFCL